MRSSIAFLQSVPDERCGVRERDELLDWGERRESFSAFSLASRACLMRSSIAFLQSVPEERCGVRERDEPLD